MAKTGIAALAEGRTDLFRMDPRKIVVREGWNSRDFDLPENKDHVATLAKSIVEVGVKEPLAGFLEGGEFILTNGESRLRAVLSLIEAGTDVKTVPVQPEPRHASEADHLASQIIRNSGKPFTPIENAKVYAKLIDLGWTAKEIADKTGMTVERVNQIARLNAVTPTVRKHIQKGEVSSTLVQRIQAKAKDAKDVETQVSAAIKKAKTEGKKKATPKHAKPGPSIPAKPKVDYKALFIELVDSLGDGQAPSDGEQNLHGTIAEDRWEHMVSLVPGRGKGEG